MSEGPRILNDQETEELVDRAFIKATGKTWRPEDKDTLAQIEHDFPSVFGGEGKI